MQERNSRKSIKSEKFETLLEVSAASALTFTALASTVLLVNLAWVGLNQSTVNLVAETAAKDIDAQRYWLGMPREDYDQAKSKEAAHELADRMLSELGLPQSKTFELDERSINTATRKVTITRVKLSLKGLDCLGGVLTPLVALCGSGTSCNNTAAPYATMVMNVSEASKTGEYKQQKVVLPVYGSIKNSINTDLQTDNTLFAQVRGYAQQSTVLQDGHPASLKKQVDSQIARKDSGTY